MTAHAEGPAPVSVAQTALRATGRAVEAQRVHLRTVHDTDDDAAHVFTVPHFLLFHSGLFLLVRQSSQETARRVTQASALYTACLPCLGVASFLLFPTESRVVWRSDMLRGLAAQEPRTGRTGQPRHAAATPSLCDARPRVNHLTGRDGVAEHHTVKATVSSTRDVTD